MLEQYLSKNNYEECIKNAIYNLKINEFEKTLSYLRDAICQNDSSGEFHNLLGILYEKKGDLNLAAKHYRAASDLDPTLYAASANLERVTAYSYIYIVKIVLTMVMLKKYINHYILLYMMVYI